MFIAREQLQSACGLERKSYYQLFISERKTGESVKRNTREGDRPNDIAGLILKRSSDR